MFFIIHIREFQTVLATIFLNVELVAPRSHHFVFRVAVSQSPSQRQMHKYKFVLDISKVVPPTISSRFYQFQTCIAIPCSTFITPLTHSDRQI